jgi:hypothetical protein
VRYTISAVDWALDHAAGASNTARFTKNNMENFQHSESCLKQQRESEAAREAYRIEWPNHCSHCEGWGGSSVKYDPSPSGVGLSSGYMWDFEPCEHCAGKCPRCANPMEEDASACSSCGWTLKDGGMPAPVEDCGCWDAWRYTYDKVFAATID